MTSQLEFSLKRGGKTQCGRILERLQSSPNKRIPMPELARVGSGTENGFCMVHSRIADLRKNGHRIEHSQEWIGGTCCSYYRLVIDDKIPANHPDE